jgi:hypothetical protein
MNPYNQAAFGFAKAYQMNMRAADEQRNANQPSSDAFAESLADEETDYTYAQTTQAPVPPDEEYTGIGSDEGTILDRSNGNLLKRAKGKATKYLQLGD